MDIEQRQFDRPAYATATVAPGAANVAEVTVTLRNVNGKPVGPTMLPLYLAGLSSGETIDAVTPSGGFACKTPGVTGTDIAVLSAGKVVLIQTMGTGVYVLALTDASKRAFRIALMIGEVAQVVATLATANYG